MTITLANGGRAVALVCIAFLMAKPSMAQSFNLDLEIEGGSQAVGGGPPSASFGAAAEVFGFWNPIRGNGPSTPVFMKGLDGEATGASIWVTGGFGLSGGFNNTLDSGDERLLMNDFADIGLPGTSQLG